MPATQLVAQFYSLGLHVHELRDSAVGCTAVFFATWSANRQLGLLRFHTVLATGLAAVAAAATGGVCRFPTGSLRPVGKVLEKA